MKPQEFIEGVRALLEEWDKTEIRTSFMDRISNLLDTLPPPRLCAHCSHAVGDSYAQDIPGVGDLCSGCHKNWLSQGMPATGDEDVIREYTCAQDVIDHLGADDPVAQRAIALFQRNLPPFKVVHVAGGGPPLRVVAVKDLPIPEGATAPLLSPKPVKKPEPERDKHGHFKTCYSQGCNATKCGTSTPPPMRNPFA